MKRIISTMIAALMAINMFAVSASAAWDQSVIQSKITYSYSANGIVQSAVQSGFTAGQMSVNQTIHYDATGRQTYVENADGTVTQVRKYNSAGNLSTIDMLSSDPNTGASIVVTNYYLSGNTVITVNHGDGATLNSSGASGGSNYYTDAQVQTAFNSVAGGSSWSSQGINVYQISMSGAGIKKLGSDAVARLYGFSQGSSVITNVMESATSNLTTTFTATMDANGKASTLSYYDGSCKSTQVINLAAAEAATVAQTTSATDPLVTGTLVGPALQPVTDAKGIDHYYVSVKAAKVDMFDGNPAADADGETIFVEVDKTSYDSINAKYIPGTETQITIAGNVTDQKYTITQDGVTKSFLTMTLNGGGFAFAEGDKTSDQVWMGSHQTWYNDMVTAMIKLYNSNGIGLNEGWSTKWNKLEGVVQPNF